MTKILTPEQKERKRIADKKRYILNKEKLLAQSKERKLKNKEKIAAQNKIYHEKNKEAIKERKRKWYAENKEKIKIKNKAWRIANIEHINRYQIEYESRMYKTNPLFKLKTRIRKAIRESFNSNGFTKKTKTQNILGCTFDELKLHLESQFQPWMSWDNHGLYNGTENYGWDIDHIIPISSAVTEEDIIRLNHYSNLQPLCSYINRNIKKNKY